PGWSAATARAATGQVPVSEPVLLLAYGVRFPMRRALILWSAVLLTGGLVAGLVWANADAPKVAPEVPKPPERLLKPDPKAGPVADKLKGVWVAEQVSPNGDSRRDHVMRFVDGTHVIWSIAQ